VHGATSTPPEDGEPSPRQRCPARLTDEKTATDRIAPAPRVHYLTTAPGPPPRLPAASCAAKARERENIFFFNNIINWITPNLPLKAIEREKKKQRKFLEKSGDTEATGASERVARAFPLPQRRLEASAPIRSVASSSRFACLVWLVGRSCRRRR
jgi:hypothetical protein